MERFGENHFVDFPAVVNIRPFCHNGFSEHRGRTMSTQPTADPELVEIFDTMQESEAMIVHGLLTSSGIESLVTYREAPDVLAAVGGISVRVNPAQEEEARRVIQDYLANGASDDDSAPPESDAGGPGETS
jgi:Putative prokaryotic signal transducing protein